MQAGYHPAKENDPEKNTLKKQGFYHSPAWRRIRVLALQRDNYLCQVCLKKGVIKKATEVHHIRPIAKQPELALELENLQSLCWWCHEATKSRGTDAVSASNVRIIKITNKQECTGVEINEEK